MKPDAEARPDNEHVVPDLPRRPEDAAVSAARPDRAMLTAAAGVTVADVIAPGLDVLFCGINPSLYSAATGYHFARPGNRFWPTLHRAGFTPRQLAPAEQGLLPDYGCGITNFVERATAAAAELSGDELREGARRLEAKLDRYRPAMLAVLGIGAYRSALGLARVALGPQPRSLGGVPVWVLPNPSGLNAHYRLDDLVRLFAELRQALAARR